MTKNKRFVKSVLGLAVCSMVLALASPSFAQWREERRGNGTTRTYMDRLIRQAENRSDQFVRVLDRDFDRVRWNDSWREDRLKVRAMDLERQLNIIRQQFDRANNPYMVRSHVVNAMNVAQSINNTMRNRNFDFRVERQWSMLRSDLNRLAAAFNVRQI